VNQSKSWRTGKGGINASKVVSRRHDEKTKGGGWGKCLGVFGFFGGSHLGGSPLTNNLGKGGEAFGARRSITTLCKHPLNDSIVFLFLREGVICSKDHVPLLLHFDEVCLRGVPEKENMIFFRVSGRRKGKVFFNMVGKGAGKKTSGGELQRKE